jgi:DHA2 family multidrug resistance protein-like MFS transporter
VLQGVGGAMMVPVGRLTVMKIVPRDQYMAAMTFVTLPGQVGPLLGPALGGMLVEYASWHWIFLINIPVGIVGAIATLCLMPNYTCKPGALISSALFCWPPGWRPDPGARR